MRQFESLLNSNFAHKFAIVVLDKSMTLASNSGVAPYTHFGSLYLDPPTGYDHCLLMSVTAANEGGVPSPVYMLDYASNRISGVSYNKSSINVRGVWLCYND